MALANDLLGLCTPEDRRAWPRLLLVSLLGGLAKSGILACINLLVERAGDVSAAWRFGILTLLMILLTLLAEYFVLVRGQAVSVRLSNSLRRHLLNRINAADLRLVERRSASALHYLLWETVDRIEAGYRDYLRFCSAAVTLGFNLLYVGWLSWAGLLLALSIALVGATLHWRKEQQALGERRQLDAWWNQSQGMMRTALDGFKELKLSAPRQHGFMAAVDAHNSRLLAQHMTVVRNSAGGLLGTQALLFVAVTLVAAIMPGLGGMTAVTTLQLIAAVLFTVGPLEAVIQAISDLGRAKVAVRNVSLLEDEIWQAAEPVAAQSCLPAFEHLQLHAAVFDFAAEAGAPAGEGGFAVGPLDFSLQRGEIVFVTGGNGSGKTVLMRLLSGLYRIQSGQLRYNGQLLADDALAAWRANFACVFNDFYLFREIMTPDADPVTVTRWLEYFDLADKVRYVDGAFSSVALSTGQRKRLALISAILERRPVLILDEFAADQDPAHRQLFYRVWLPELRQQGFTLVVVSHDDAYFDAADRLIRLDFGRIAER